MPLRTICATALAATLLSGCSLATPSQSTLPSEPLSVNAAAGGKIQHVVYIMQVGRSFNSLFLGYPRAHTVSTGETSNGHRVTLQPVSLKTKYVVDHSANAMFEACNGTSNVPGTDCRMNGFNNEATGGAPKHLTYPQYVYVDPNDTKPYVAMAREWVLADSMFASQLDSDFVAGQYSIAAQADRAVDFPAGHPCYPEVTVPTLTSRRRIGGIETACFAYQTLGGELDAAKRSWRYYQAPDDEGAGSYDAISKFYRDNQYRKNVVSPPNRFFTDLSAGNLANFTWITPLCADSDDAGCGAPYGPSWVAAIVNAIGKSKFWDSTAIFVQWNDWGGMYDDVPPQPLDFDGLGFRVPLLVISPYAKRDYLSHVHYETTSVLRFAEDIFGLPRMSVADRRAISPAADCFDFSQPPRAFVPIPAPKGEGFFRHQ
jgi:phospholipase C